MSGRNDSPGAVADAYEKSEGFAPLVPQPYHRWNDDDAHDEGSDE